MSNAGGYIKSGIKLFDALNEGKPHSSITDWVEVLTSDRYEELSLDGVPELVESINIQGASGTTEGARAIRKKLKYGNVHRQLRALVILRALTENAGKGFKLNWANPEIVTRLKDMAQDALLDPNVKKRLFLVFHAWAIQYKDEPRMQHVARLYSQYGGGGPTVRKPTAVHSSATTASPRASIDAGRPSRGPEGGFNDYDSLFSHDWAPAPGKRGPDTYADLAAAKADAEERKRQREARIALEHREAELERREREIRRKSEMEALNMRRQREAEQEAERRRKAREEMLKAKRQPAQAPAAAQPKRPKFDFQKEKPQVLVAVANAIQTANNLVNSCRHLNREFENVRESPRVQENLDKAKAARRIIVRYIQLVTDEEFVGTLIDANEKIVEAIQLYDKLSKPALLDSDSDEEAPPADKKDIDNLQKRLEAQKLEADRTGELQRMQERQKRESAKREQRRLVRQASMAQAPTRGHPDLDDLDFGSISKDKASARLPQPLHPDSDYDSQGGGLSDYSDYDYNSSDDEWRASRSRRPSMAAGPSHAKSSGQANHYRSLADDGTHAKKGLLDSNDPFGDPFADDNDTPLGEKQRMTWTEI
ncbi:hypothetical protein BD324DRAFT_611568 [Kockovaella imperatae]|uniref:VHS domain-containing protein n=1 Tax=Kockovaella imperatae TaxID=4999 RepID=A0A1Y1UT70_9TREE|nr:hypothetical protein BD324DRAFT_611568 [Kockovaella imperatae]ORX40626.1 hypothetical protein BD324DRAFT_611568 [Kockovaella imperatae]